MQEEDALAREQKEAAARAAALPDAGDPSPAAAAADAAAARLAKLFAALDARRRLRQLAAAGEALGLRDASLPRRLLQVRVRKEPDCAADSDMRRYRVSVQKILLPSLDAEGPASWMECRF